MSSLILILNGIISASITELWSHFSPEHTKHFQNAAVPWKYNVPIDFFFLLFTRYVGTAEGKHLADGLYRLHGFSAAICI